MFLRGCFALLACAAAGMLWGAEDGLPFIRVASDKWHFESQGGRREVRSGRHALQALIDPPANGHAAVYQTVRIAGKAHLAAAAWWCGKGGEVRLRLVFRDAAQHELASSWARAASGGTEWQRLSVNAAAPRKAVAADVVILAAGAGGFSIDDVSLSGKDGENLLTNPGFEEGWKGWHQGVEADNAGLLWVNDSRFVPWGLNYDRTILDGKDILLEEAPIAKVDRDFREARRLGANAVRVFLELSRFMPRYMELDESTFAFFDQVIQRARKYNLRLDVTGLSHINGTTLPAWYNERSDDDVTAAEAAFWGAMARRYAAEPAILMFDLQNEPFVSGKGPLKTFGCFTMSGGRQFCYVNPHFREIGAPASEKLRREKARAWTKAMVESIRRHDPRHMITIGLLPSAAPVFGEGSPGFVIPEVADLLDIIAIHLYPDRKAAGGTFLEVNQSWLEMVLRYASGFGKPVIVEEWFSAIFSKEGNPQEWFGRFLAASRPQASGWFTFYHALLVDGRETAPLAPGDWSRLFRDTHAEMWTADLMRARATTTLKIDPDRLWAKPEEVKTLFDEYRRLRKQGAVVDFQQ